MDRLTVFDHAGGYLFELAEADVFGRVRVEELNGEHSLTLTTTRVLEKGQRLLSKDATGKWREWVVQGIDADHSSGLAMVGTYYCIWSLQHDLSLCVTTAMPGVQTPVAAASALAGALEPTVRWTVGTVTQTKTAGGSFYFLSSWEALGVLVERWGGEVDAAITVDKRGNVTARQVCLYSQMGNQTATRRFDWGHDLAGIKRTVSDEPFPCRIIPRGKGEETDTGGYGRKIDITSVNGGRNYLQNDATAPLVRLPTPSGGWEYPTITVENGEMETPADLKAWAEGVLESYTTPKVTYEADVVQLAEAGMDVKGVQLGDAVQCVDRGFDPDGVRVQGRVVRVEADELAGGSQLVLGNLSGNLGARLGTLGSKLDQVAGAVQVMNGGTMSTADYLNRLLERVNAEINATGGYTYITEGEGIRTYDRAVTDPLVGAEATAVVEMKGGTIRIANSRTSSGAWDWKTVFTSGHIAADMVTAARLTAGYIGSPSGNYWNLDTGQVRLLGTAQVGSTTVNGLVQDIEAAEEGVRNVKGDVSLLKAGSTNSVDVQYGLSSSAKAQPTSWVSSASGLWNQKGKYLWQRQKMTYVNGKTAYAAPRLVSDGRQLIKSVTEEYYLSNSKASPTGGSWSQKQQAYIHGRYYFTRSRVEYVNGVVEYVPSAKGDIASAYITVTDVYDSRLDQKKVFNKLTNNGRAKGLATDSSGNLYVNADYISTGVLSDKRGANYWNLDTGDFKLSALGALESKVDAIKVGGENLIDGTSDWSGWLKRGNFAVSGDTASSAARAITTANQWNNSMLSPVGRVTYGQVQGREVTISFDMKTTGAWGTVAATNSVSVCVRLCNAQNYRQRWQNWQVKTAPTTSWQRHSFTFNAVNATFTGGTAAFYQTYLLGVEIYNRSGRQLSIRRVKIEVGNVATDWSASSNDAVLAAAAKANKALSDAKDDTAAKIKTAKKDAYAESKRYADSISTADREYTDKQKKDLDDSLNAEKVFNKLSGGGTIPGLYTSKDSKGKVTGYYFNASYINTGTLNAKVLKAGIITPNATTKGSFNINLATGYIKANNMELTNMNATGTITTGSGASKMQLTSGQLRGYQGSARVGFIDATASIYLKDKNKSVYGLQLQADNIIRISTPRLGVSKSANVGVETTTTFTGSIFLNNLTYGMNRNMTSCSTGSIELKFINGLFVGWGKYTHPMFTVRER